MTAAVLSLREILDHDPGAPGEHRRERRFLCPLAACQGHADARRHRSLSLNTETGLWHCNRCGEGGKVSERWEDRRPLDRRGYAFRSMKKLTALPQARMPAPAAADWRKYVQKERSGRCPLAGTDGEAFLSARGIGADLAHNSGARFCSSFMGRPAVIFPLADLDRQTVAVQGRHTDGREDPKCHSAGPIGRGIFATAGAWEADRIVLCEAPIDALSLAAAGLPAFALCGTAVREWILPFCAWKTVLLAFDGDQAGDQAAEEWCAALAPFGASVERLRPFTFKDWNEELQALGADQLGALIAALPQSGNRCQNCGAPSGSFSVCSSCDPFA